jgi:chromate transport protein ChrA
MAIAWFGPLFTLPSFLLAVLFSFIISRKSNLNRALGCRIISALILIGIIATVLCRCISAEIEARQFSNYAEWFKHTHPNYEYAPTGTNPR